MQKRLYNKTVLGVLLIAASPYAARAEHAAERLDDAATVFEEIMSARRQGYPARSPGQSALCGNRAGSKEGRFRGRGQIRSRLRYLSHGQQS